MNGSSVEPRGRRRINAYVLAADPWWLEDSVGSYYDLVDRIVVSYDENSLSWTGTPLPVEECLARLRAVDPHGKLDLRPGRFFHPDRTALQNDTAQRQVALNQASGGAEWVLQLDTDEVLLDADALVDAIEEAESRGCAAVEYPARYLYSRSRSGWMLETARPLWRRRAGYPGPVAIQAGATLSHCRQSQVPVLRVDMSATNTDPTHPADAPVHRVVRPDQAILHYSWVRDDEYMARKAAWSGHSDTYTRMLDAWRGRTRRPIVAAAFGWLRRDGEWHRLTRLPAQMRYWRGES